MRRFLLLPLVFVLSPAFALDCRCACMAGQAVTLCARADAAREARNLCPLEFRCPAAPLASGSAAGEDRAPGLAPPVRDAVNCRSEAVWNAANTRYEPRNVCNLRTPATR